MKPFIWNSRVCEADEVLGATGFPVDGHGAKSVRSLFLGGSPDVPLFAACVQTTCFREATEKAKGGEKHRKKNLWNKVRMQVNNGGKTQAS